MPSRRERRRLRRLLPLLAHAERRLAEARGVASVAHGFVHGRSPVTCALAHVGTYAATVTADLRRWFDSVRRDQIAAALRKAGIEDADEIAEAVTVDGIAAQGLPTSPAAANLAAVAMDEAISAAMPPGAVYTRYADDLTVSVHDEADVEVVIALVADAAQAQGWEVHPQKTQVYRARAGRRVVVGISVGPDGIRIGRRMRRRLRAALHGDPGSPQADGLAEWARLRLPRAARPARRIRGAAATARPRVAPAPVPSSSPSASTTRSRAASGGRVIRVRRDR